jgi:diadenosine hexaphosphate hydrolase (ATP-forming)
MSQHQPRDSAGGIIVNAKGELLLVEQHHNSWTFPKGGIEDGETELEAALREVREETGLGALENCGLLGSYSRYSIGRGGVGETKEWGNRRRTFFLFKALEDIPQGFADPEGEITAVRWVGIDEALSLMTHPKDKEFLESVRGKIESILE